MARGEVLISHINSVQFFTYQYLTYISRPAKFTVRDVDFSAGSQRYIEVISNIDLTDEDKESLLSQMDYVNLDHLDLPANRRELLDAVVTVPKISIRAKSDFEYAGVKLSKALIDFSAYFDVVDITPDKMMIENYINDLGTGDPIRERASIVAIAQLIRHVSLKVKLGKVLAYTSSFNTEFPEYIESQLPQFDYLTALYGAYKSNSYKPNELPYIAIRN